MKILSLFNGISCGMAALERAGIPVERYVSFEIDKYANAVTVKNYPQIELRGDVKTADFTEFEGFDLVLAAFRVRTYPSPKETEKDLTANAADFCPNLSEHSGKSSRNTSSRKTSPR